MQDHLNQSAELVLKMNGKSFYFAGMLLGATRLGPISKLYSACRYIDDCADENSPEEGRRLIAGVSEELKRVMSGVAIQSGEPPTRFEQLVIDLVDQGVEPQNLRELIQGAEFDLEEKQIQDLPALLHYCYLVAGVVGLMMCPLLGTRAYKARQYAVDLGIGMQLTNICRDVLEDYKNNRVYLPELQAYRADLKASRSSDEIKLQIRKYLDIADQFYFSGYRGLSFLPIRSRLAILVAGEVYRHIGLKIRRQGYDVLRGRTILSLGEKLWVALRSCRYFFKKCFWVPQPHNEVGGFAPINSLVQNKGMEIL